MQGGIESPQHYKFYDIIHIKADLNYGLTGGTAQWTGEGVWTATASPSPLCIKFYDPDNNKPTCCCDLADRTLAQVHQRLFSVV